MRLNRKEGKICSKGKKKRGVYCKSGGELGVSDCIDSGDSSKGDIFGCFCSYSCCRRKSNVISLSTFILAHCDSLVWMQLYSEMREMERPKGSICVDGFFQIGKFWSPDSLRHNKDYRFSRFLIKLLFQALMEMPHFIY